MSNEALEDEFGEDIEEQAVAWFVRLRADNVSRQDELAFIHWLEQTDTHRSAFYDVCDMWGDKALLASLINSADQHGIAPKSEKKPYRATKLPLAFAAGLLLAVMVWEHVRVWAKADYISAVGENKTVQLDDGSTAILHTDSAFAFNIRDKQRHVELLKGEVYFNVKPVADQPFFVQARHSTTRVLGTRFFVSRGIEHDEIKVLSGRVEVSEGRIWRTPVVLNDQQFLTVDDTALGMPQKLDSMLLTSWISGYLVYNDEPLEAVINNINRYRRGMVFFKDDSLRKLRINGRIKIGEADDMLKVLQKAMNLRMTYLTNWVVIVG